MTEARRMQLHLGTCIEDLDNMYNVPDLKSKKAKLLCNSAQKLFDKAEKSREKGDEETSYVCYMKYLRIVAYLSKDPEYERDKKFFNDLLGVKNPAKAIAMAEQLKTSLISRYDVQKKAKRLADIQEQELMKQKLNEERSRIASTATNNKDNVAPGVLPGASEVVISCQRLFSILRAQHRVLILDTRAREDFLQSHIDHTLCVNVPAQIITAGCSAHKLEGNLPEASRAAWTERGSMDLIVLLDYNSEAVIPSQPLHLLKTILLKWDIKTHYPREPVALLGGYCEWLHLYPSHATDPRVATPAPPPPPPPLALVQYPDSLHVGDTRNPAVDRSSKAAAIQTYEERARSLQLILDQQEQLAASALSLEMQRIQAEHAWESVHEQTEAAEAAARDEPYAAFALREQEILSQLMQLENKQYDMQQENQSLRELLEQYQRRERDRLAEEQDGEPERVLARQARISAVQEERRALDKTREALERERKRKLAEARDKRKPDAEGALVRAHSTPNIAKTGDREEPPPPTVPLVDRGVKPKPPPPVDCRSRDLQPVWGEVERGLTGLKNLGNTCYMNSVMQCLNNTSHLAAYLCGDKYREHINRTSGVTRGAVAEELAVVVRALWSGKYRFIAAKDLQSVVGKYQRRFGGCEQQDSHEFLTILMDWLHDDLQIHVARPHQESQSPADRAWSDYTRGRESLVLRLFYGQMKSSVRCTVCGHESVTYDSFSNLSLELPASAARCSITDCLRLYLGGETVPGWDCPGCRDKRDAVKKLDISRLPPVLVIHFKRFYADPNFNSYRKKQTYIDFPLDRLDMGGSSYSLYGVSNHYGDMESGHYTAYCKNSCGKWYKFDDHLVSEMSASDVKSSAAYILFYSLHGQTAPPP